MNRLNDETSLRTAAIVAGAAILAMTLAAVVATDGTIGGPVVRGDAAATAANISASPGVFRLGVFSWLMVLICDAFAAWGLYVYFRPVNRDVSLLTGWIRLTYVVILGAAVLNLLSVLPLLSGAHGADRLATNALLSIETFDTVFSAGLVVFGLHLLGLGYLTLKSGYAPKVFGVLMVLASVDYALSNAANMLFPWYEHYKNSVDVFFLIPMVAGEVGLGLWLVIKGGRVQPARGAVTAALSRT